MIQFVNDFQRKKTTNGLLYIFQITKQQQEGDCCVEGEIISSDEPIESIQEKCKRLPEECLNPVRYKAIFTQWLQDCKGAFVKPPTLTQCLSNVSSFCDTKQVVEITPEEEDDDWTLLWVPTTLHLISGSFQIGWSPIYKKKSTRIPAMSEGLEEANMKEIHEIQISTNSDPTRSNEWDELLETEPQTNHKEKLRRRIREARIRAKLAKYRAERLANQFYRKYNSWPEEDQDEAETVYESSEESIDL